MANETMDKHSNKGSQVELAGSGSQDDQSITNGINIIQDLKLPGDTSEPMPGTVNEATVSTSHAKVFFSEEHYNKLSVGGIGRLTEQFIQKKRQFQEIQPSRPMPHTDVEGDTSTKKQRASKWIRPSISNEGILYSNTTKPTGSTLKIDNGPDQKITSSSELVASTTGKFDIIDLMASVSSYVPEIASVFHSTDPKQANSEFQQQKPQQPEQPGLLQMLPPKDRFYHPCIYSHEHRSTLTREEHCRYIMYDSIIRGLHKHGGVLQLGSEDRELWTSLQERVNQERQSVRQWNAETVRARIASYSNVAIQAALETKFLRARRRVLEEYPRRYDFIQSIGLRLPGVPSVKEPTLSRKKANVIAPPGGLDKPQSNSVEEPHPRGLLKRTGKVCPVSLAKPIWPTDENGVPYEKSIDINGRYWSQSGESSTSQKASNGLRDNRRIHLPSTSPAPSVSKDPTIKHFVKEQNIHIAFAASALVTLAETLPSLASEWEIPVKVVLEEDHEGVMQKRVYVDKPLIRKRMSALEMTQAFYNGALKKLSLIATSSTDAAILSSPLKEHITLPSSTSSEQDRSENAGKIALEHGPTVPLDHSESTPPISSQQADKGSLKNPANAGDAEQNHSKMMTGREDKDENKDKDEDKDMNMDIDDEEEGVLGSQAGAVSSDEYANDGFDYSLWTFGDTRILIRSRIHGYLDNTAPCRQVVLKSILDYAPEIGLSLPSKSTMAGWWMATWIRDDRLVALGRVDVSKNQFVRYMDPKSIDSAHSSNPENPLGATFSDLPAISIVDASTLRVQEREIQDWIKPNMRSIHYVIGKLIQLRPGQYILGHKRSDINANIYKAVEEGFDESNLSHDSIKENKGVTKGGTAVSKGQYDLHAAHQSSPQLLNENNTDISGAGGAGLNDDDLQLQWVGTPDQILGTFPYEVEPEPVHVSMHDSRRGRGRAVGKRSRAKKNGQNN
ncbi:hypothetical protein BCR41DRAFT_352881 [Lobosporangium transversale]|uniref:Little elongation complex subunit 2 C-terminal domain-containing protein n=1 Tax=Lobosporangium transversale TaxID=64571 RepID=A0A1Y2GN95_9FUNG|nr:hypothetical protein BCR41DRAFT_352881 [Lobosporangium transversale]ORZ16642.1 hypothetical protein BCR41DRAFT_352881 [Lobosporangium transversale]|eukprot:XP_021881577.1 hypothetical protein BCR41DRAFT_352881 [Lobosporangium transversale]